MSVSPASSSAPWTVEDSARLYRFADWGEGYFGISEGGRVVVYPTPGSGPGIELLEVVEGLEQRGVHPPTLLRFSGVHEHRLRTLGTVFNDAIRDLGYAGRYALAYPIKVNQQRQVCEEIREAAKELGFGFEVGSRPELIAALGLTVDSPQMPIVCNGFKDEEYLQLVILASELGRPVTPVIERLEELDVLIRLAVERERCPAVGVRTRLSAAGAGRWSGTSGVRGKFGLSASDLLEAIRRMEGVGLLSRLEMLHCHIGSQVQEIAAVKRAVDEMAHLYVELRRLGAPIRVLDIGGGVGIDYVGAKRAADFSVDYTLREYAADVVYRIQSVCDQEGMPHPDLVTETGRAVVAYGSVLVLDVLGARTLGRGSESGSPRDQGRRLGPEEGENPNGGMPALPKETADAVPTALRDLAEAEAWLDAGEDPVVVVHDVNHARQKLEELFALGRLTLEERARGEELYWSVARRLLSLGELGNATAELTESMADQYYCNFSIFQSLPDVWAIGQRLPITPIHRLDEAPDRRAVLADITCDSDGRVDAFIDSPGDSGTLPLHHLVPQGERTEPYYLGVFLVGAYQETLGALHNLLGDTHVVHVASHEDGSWEIEEVIEGDTTEEVLRYVQYDPETLRKEIEREVERGLRKGRLSLADAVLLRRLIAEGLRAYTYLRSGGPLGRVASATEPDVPSRRKEA